MVFWNFEFSTLDGFLTCLELLRLPVFFVYPRVFNAVRFLAPDFSR